MHHESRNLPVAQVLPHTPDEFTTAPTTTTTTPGSRAKRYVEGSHSSRKTLFGGSADAKKKGGESRWKGSEAATGGLSPEQTFVVPTMEETMNQSLYPDNELRRIMGSPLRNNQGQRSTLPQTSPNSYMNPYHNAPVNISPEYRSHSNLSSHYGSSLTHTNDLYSSTNYAGLPRSHDLNDWQRIQHQQLQAQLEHLHITSQSLNSGVPYLGNTVGLGGSSLGGIGCSDELNKVEGLIRAKEGLIHEKNMVIER